MELIRGVPPVEIEGDDGHGYGFGYGSGYGDGSGYGYGYGSGYWSGYGYGYGSGYGDGSGYGYGSGYGDGSGSGSGDGDGDGSGDGSGDGYGSGSGDGSGSGSGDGDILAVARAQVPPALAADPRVIALWRSEADGRPANGGVAPPVYPGLVQREPGPLRAECGQGQLHATLRPERWKGERIWIVALGGAVRGDAEKLWALEREIICEVRLPGPVLG